MSRESGNSFANLRVSDLMAFAAAARAGSVTGGARELRTTAPQVSKAVARLEGVLGSTLFNRSSRGVVLSDQGRRLLPELEAVLGKLQEFKHPESEAARDLTVAAPSFLLAALAPLIAARISEVRVRAVELPPAVIRGSLTENLFDVALSLGQVATPSSWATASVGRARRGLFANPALAAKIGIEDVAVERIAEFPFVNPICLAGARFAAATDDCPLPREQRRNGHEVSTAQIALAIAVRVPQLVYAPVMAAKPLLESGDLVEIRVLGWNDGDDVWVVCNQDRVRASDFEQIVELARAHLQATR